MDDNQIAPRLTALEHRTTALLWVVGLLAGLTVAMFGNLVVQSYQLGQTIGRLDVIIAHAQLK